MADPNVYQQLGRLQSEVAQLKEGQRDMNTKLDTLILRGATQSGVRSTLIAIAGGGGVIGGIAVGLLQWWAAFKPHQ
jgi:hypothetical protein